MARVAGRRRSYRPKPRDRVTFKYRRQFGVIVVCPGEPEQRELYDRLRSQGLSCRVVCV